MVAISPSRMEASYCTSFFCIQAPQAILFGVSWLFRMDLIMHAYRLSRSESRSNNNVRWSRQIIAPNPKVQ